MHPDKGGNIVIGIADSKIVGIVIWTTGMKDLFLRHFSVHRSR
jgi:hypothetical protein